MSHQSYNSSVQKVYQFALVTEVNAFSSNYRYREISSSLLEARIKGERHEGLCQILNNKEILIPKGIYHEFSAYKAVRCRIWNQIPV
jgi:hypothetical protein